MLSLWPSASLLMSTFNCFAGNTLASHLWGRGWNPGTASSGKAGSCLPLVGSLQYRTLTNCMYWFPLPFQLPVVKWPVRFVCNKYELFVKIARDKKSRDSIWIRIGVIFEEEWVTGRHYLVWKYDPELSYVHRETDRWTWLQYPRPSLWDNKDEKFLLPFRF